VRWQRQQSLPTVLRWRGSPVTVATHRDRWAQILELLTDADPETPLVERVCAVSALLLDVSGAGMCLIGGRRHRIIVHGTDDLAEELELLQLSLGQGPCIEAVRTGLPVVVPELRNEHPDRWVTYAEQALSRGVRAVFTFPLQIAAVDLGALDLYRLQPGPLTREQTDDVLILADRDPVDAGPAEQDPRGRQCECRELAGTQPVRPGRPRARGRPRHHRGPGAGPAAAGLDRRRTRSPVTAGTLFPGAAPVLFEKVGEWRIRW
jgi:GAF domain-containing protein